ncbi:MAG: D-alanyl-D-alanine carboxypeptidase family protein [Lachnospiraceae bacterium]
MKRKLSFLLFFLFILIIFSPLACFATENKQASNAISIEAASACLMEADSGQILYEKNSEQARPLASVTKVMTLLLTFEAIDSGKLSYKDIVTVSDHAASMGGSQVFLEVGEQQTVDDLLKCIIISSANDASVAMAEHIAGSEEAFVKKMNEKAKKLDMKHTNFLNCCGLDIDGHVSCARDIAIMSRELTTKHPDVFRYTKIWMDEITHKTKKGETAFGLSNTNKLIRQYHGATGLKTGSTSIAKFCLSATATRNNINLIAVVMACPDSKQRVKDASTLLDYGFANCSLYTDDNPSSLLKSVPIQNGVKQKIAFSTPKTFSYTCTSKVKKEDIKKQVALNGNLKAPIKKGATLGQIEYTLNGKVIGTLPITAAESIKKITYPIIFFRTIKTFFQL